MSSSSEENLPKKIGRYELRRVLGEGASGIVHRAYDPIMDRVVAIKSAKADSLSAEQIQLVIDEFRHEARIAGKYAHENIVGIYDVIEANGLDHIVMEHVAGRAVTEYLASIGPMAPETVLPIVQKCAVGLAYVHYHGIIHRDIKPGNILYHHAGNLVKIMDFSIAHEIDKPGERQNGTLAYMAPEHFDTSRRITALTDIFALGATMYRMLVKRYPFTNDDTVSQILYAHQTPVSEIRSDVPREVNDLVERAMAKDDIDRFQSAAEFAYAIENVLARHYPEVLNATNADSYMTL